MEFWSNLNTHPYRSSMDQLDRDTLLLNQAKQRKLWHQAINFPGNGYNLSQINKELLQQMKDRHYWIDWEKSTVEGIIPWVQIPYRLEVWANNSPGSCFFCFFFFFLSLTPNTCPAFCLKCWPWLLWVHLICAMGVMVYYWKFFPYVLPSTIPPQIDSHQTHQNSDDESTATSQ